MLVQITYNYMVAYVLVIRLSWVIILGRELDDLLKEAVAEMRMPDRTVILVAHRCCEQTTHIKQQTTNNKHTQQEHPDFVGLAPVYSTHPKIIANVSPDDPYITPTSYRNRSKILP